MPTSSHRLSLFVPDAMRRELEQAAREAERSLSAEVRLRLRRATASDPSAAARAVSPAEGSEKTRRVTGREASV